MANIENIKVGNTAYGIRDKNTYRSLSALQESTLLSSGKYDGEAVENNTVFLAEGGTVKKFNKTATGVTVNWTQGTLPVSEYWSAVAYGDGKYVAVAGGDYHSTNTAAYSTDGITWYSSSVPNKVWHTVTYGNGMFVAGNHYSGGSIIYSSDGINWTTATVPVAATWGVILFANNMFVALEAGHYHSKGIYSTDGINWTSFNTPFSGQFTGLAYGNGKWVGVDAFNANKYIYSTTGTSWTDGTFSVSRERRIANNGNAFVALRVGTDKADYSTDGVTWTEVTLSRTCKRIVAGDGVFLAFDDSGNACTSTDGINWQNITQMPAQYGADCCYGNGKFVFVSGYSSKSTKAGSGTATISYTYTTTPLTYTKSETDTALAAKQGTLTAGTGIAIDPDTNTISAPAMTGATSSADGAAGIVPAPTITDVDKFLKGDGSWGEVSGGTNYYTSVGSAIVGQGAPTSSVPAVKGQVYVDSTTGLAYVCESATLAHDWTVVGAVSIDSDGIASGFTKDAYITVPSGEGYMHPTDGTTLYYRFRLFEAQTYKYPIILDGCDMLKFDLSSSGVYTVTAQKFHTQTTQTLGTFTPPYLTSWVYIRNAMTDTGRAYSYSFDGVDYYPLGTVDDGPLYWSTPFVIGTNTYTTVAAIIGQVDLKSIVLKDTATGSDIYRVYKTTTTWTPIGPGNPYEPVTTLPASPTPGKIYFVTGA